MTPLTLHFCPGCSRMVEPDATACRQCSTQFSRQLTHRDYVFCCLSLCLLFFGLGILTGIAFNLAWQAGR